MQPQIEIPATPFFLDNLQIQVELHLSDSSLDVQRLTRLVGMSRTNLHRKLNQTIGMSATEFVRFVRLNHAAHLLVNEPDWSVYQVALEVGFNHQSYFTARFKELFGVSPIRWRESGGKLEHT